MYLASLSPGLLTEHRVLTLALPHHLWTATEPGCPHQTCSAPPAWVPWDGTLVSEDPIPAYLAHPGSPALAEQPAQTV